MSALPTGWFDCNSGDEQQILTRADGLIADHVTDVADYRGGLALATPSGLTFLDASGARSMYAFHGLVNNHVYALGVSGDQLMAGTLGGLSQLNQGDVTVNYTTTTSNLKHNWITAVVRVDSEWMVGTYGAGVLASMHPGISIRLKPVPAILKSIRTRCWFGRRTCWPELWGRAYFYDRNRDAGR